MDLLHNDLTLVLNHNFYLNCKLTEKDKKIAEIENKCCHLEERGTLSLQMAKQKYEKCIHHLKYDLFAQGKDSSKTELYQDVAEGLDSGPFDLSFPTPKKSLTLRNTHSALDHKDTLSKPKTSVRDQRVDLDKAN